MRKTNLLCLLAVLLCSGHVLATDPCYGGTEITIGYHNFCADSLPEAFQQMDIQQAIYEAQYPDPVFTHVLQYFNLGNSYCVYVQFVICRVKGQGNSTAKTIAAVNGAIGSLTSRGWAVKGRETLENGYVELLIAHQDGGRFSVVFDKDGELAHMMPVSE